MIQGYFFVGKDPILTTTQFEPANNSVKFFFGNSQNANINVTFTLFK